MSFLKNLYNRYKQLNQKNKHITKTRYISLVPGLYLISNPNNEKETKLISVSQSRTIDTPKNTKITPLQIFTADTPGTITAIPSLNKLKIDLMFEFMAWLTTREVPLTVSKYHDASRAARLTKEFLESRGISLDKH